MDKISIKLFTEYIIDTHREDLEIWQKFELPRMWIGTVIKRRGLGDFPQLLWAWPSATFIGK